MMATNRDISTKFENAKNAMMNRVGTVPMPSVVVK
jgi:hypothetical protein